MCSLSPARFALERSKTTFIVPQAYPISTFERRACKTGNAAGIARTVMAKVEIYTSPFCGYCHRAKALLTRLNVPFIEYDVVFDPAKREEMTARVPGARTVPQIFISDRPIGGSDQLAALDKAGELAALVAAPEA